MKKKSAKTAPPHPSLPPRSDSVLQQHGKSEAVLSYETHMLQYWNVYVLQFICKICFPNRIIGMYPL